MPIYEYQCKDPECKHVTEKLRRVSQLDDPCPCDKCGKETQKKVSTSNFALKGGGWASDGYGS